MTRGNAPCRGVSLRTRIPSQPGLERNMNYSVFLRNYMVML